jgi:acyl-CoA synthetase (AMP-forming)/AMP-acid ligase II
MLLKWNIRLAGKIFLSLSVIHADIIQKAVMISHRNVISNVLQHVTYDSVARRKKGVETQTVTGFLPFSHIYGLVIAAHTCTWRGDQVIVLPKFEFSDFLKSIQEFKIRQLLVVSVTTLLAAILTNSFCQGATNHHSSPAFQGYLRQV